MTHAANNDPSASQSSARVVSGRLVVLRWERIGKDVRWSKCGRFRAFRCYNPKHWTLTDRGTSVDYAPWSKICATARERIEREAQHNNPSDAPSGRVE